jgi:general secretion pathway protein G
MILKTNPKGFSMIELMVVMVIMGLIAGLVGPRFFGRADLAKVQTAETQIQMMKSALSLFYLDMSRFPTTEEGLGALVRKPREAKFWQGPYLGEEVPLDPWGGQYHYENKRSGLSEISLFSLGADGAEGGQELNADIGYKPDS